MSLWKIAWRSIQQRMLVSSLTALSMGLGVALVVSVLVVYGIVEQSFHRGGEGYDLIVGAKGGKEQLVLNSVFYLSQPVGSIPYSLYEELREGSKFAANVETAIPLCMGHEYQGFRVVGTVPEMFTELKYRDGRAYAFAEGRNFDADEPLEAVMGSIAAVQTASSIGEEFKAVHGGRVHDDRFKLVGILKPTGTPVDRAVFVNMKGFFDIHGREAIGHEDHDHDGHDHGDGDEAKQITAILLCIRQEPPGLPDVVAKEINKGKIAQAVEPQRVISDLFEGIVGKLQWILLGMAVLTVIVAGISIMVSIFNSMSDRRHEIAVMRALGARRVTVMMTILVESILLSLFGGIMGLLLAHGAIGACSGLIANQTGVAVGLLQFQLIELIVIPGLIVLASAVGYLPAMSAYRTDVARALTNTP
jgi:putative ABC transport system permease protein